MAKISSAEKIKMAKISSAEKKIEKARKKSEKLAKKYGVPVSSVVWIGNNKYIVVKDGNEIRI